MNPNRSPWIHQLNRTRPIVHLVDHISTQVAIVGAGIAGISTAYFILKNTDKKVALIEANKVAHGATGHNAGQLVSYFERQFSDLVKEFGLEKTAEGQAAVDSAWQLIEQIYLDAKLQTPFHQFTGYAGIGSLQEILIHLDNSLYFKEAGLNSEQMLIAKESEIHKQLPQEYRDLYSLVPQKDILALLETDDTHYVSLISSRKGCLNSALFCEELLGYLLATYPERLVLAEETPVKEVILEKERGELITATGHKITASRIVLCTNGFERFTITNKNGDDVDKNFHHLVRGSVGYMAAYLEPRNKSPMAISYLPDKAEAQDPFDRDPYFYLTRRPFEVEKNEDHNLICVGGPESLMDDTNSYSKEHPYSQEAQQQIDAFLHHDYKPAPKGEINYRFRWHGLMGYTPNGVRCIGHEPRNPVLMYNLGCNGVGILPSVYGGQKIAWLIDGKKLPPSIFDPKEDLRN